MNAVVETRDLTKRFGDNYALTGLTITVPRGHIVGFLGRNGSGKTTTIKILLDVIRRTSGEATVLGEPTGSVAVRRRIGFLGEDKRLYSYMTVREIIAFTRPFFPAWRLETETRLLMDFELPLNHKIGALSKGMRTKLGLLLNLCRHAELLILDEPSEGLDPVMTEQMLQSLVRQAADGTTVFFSSHQVAEVEQIADHIIAIEKGRVILEGALDHLRQRFRRINLVFDDPPPAEAFRRDGVDRVIMQGRTISILASRNVDEIVALGPMLAAKSVDVQSVGLKELFLEKVKEDHANS
ncbi:MAG TPA: ABC transporter ATP-binding protein [Bryobacteraceae bacterium]|nr:ABC transporter ATP-binding protein [Bryobacteraceae bacterium]